MTAPLPITPASALDIKSVQVGQKLAQERHGVVGDSVFSAPGRPRLRQALQRFQIDLSSLKIVP